MAQFLRFILFAQLMIGMNTYNQNIRNFVSMPEKEQALLNKLFKSYNKKLKPSGTVEVKFALNLNQIVNLIEKDQIIVLNVFLDHEVFCLFVCILT